MQIASRLKCPRAIARSKSHQGSTSIMSGGPARVCPPEGRPDDLMVALDAEASVGAAGIFTSVRAR